MKHTMKKLLCMALAIMLLVSAVPVFAAAEDNVFVTITVDGETRLSESKNLNGAATLEEALSPFFPENWSANYDVAYTKNGNAGTAAWQVSPESDPATSVGAVLTTKVATVTVRFENGQSGTVTRKITGTVSLGEALLNEAALYVPDGQEIKSWNVNGTAKQNGESVGVTWDMTATCVLGSKAPAVGIITAVYSVDGGAGVEKKISSNAETVASLMEKGGYSQSSYKLTKAGLGGTGEEKHLNDTIVAGQKVYIKMATKTTPTNPTNPTNPANPTKPTTPSTSSWIDFAVKVDSSSNVVYNGGKAPANGSSAKIGDLIKHLYDSDWASKYDFDYAWSSKNQTKITDVNASVYTGDSVTVMLKTKSTSNPGSSYDYGTEGISMNFLCDGRVVYTKVVKSDAELEVAKAEAVNKIKALGCYQFNGWK